MNIKTIMLEKMKELAVGRRKLDDVIFKTDKPPPRLGVYDEDDEDLCHEVIKTKCNIPGCIYEADSLLEFENHYNSSHRYSCGQCKKLLATPHFLDLHIQENHDSFFQVLAERKPSYCCFIEECKEKFMEPQARMEHCVQIHKLPKDFRFDMRPKNPKKTKSKTKNFKNDSMEVDNETKKFAFANSKNKTFTNYTGRKFVKDKITGGKDVDMIELVKDLKDSLPQ